MLIRPGFFRKNVVVCQRNERKTENGRRRQNFGEILVKTLKNRNTGLFEPIGGCGPTNMTNGGGMNMVVLKNYKIKEQNGMYYIVPSRSEEHTSELQSQRDISYAVFCL